MIQQTIGLKMAGSLPGACIKTYIIEDSPEFKIKKRPIVIVCPGGGYCYLSDREGEILALQYVAMGCHAVVLHYSIAPAVYPAALLELASAVKLLREKAEEWHIDKDKIIVEGSSAGGHLAASYGMFWKEAFIAEELGLKASDREMLRPNAMILNYPVITSGEFAHRDSFVNLLGGRYEELVEKMSLEKQVNQDTPQAFIWHTYTDGCVPVENSL
ncbi:MAG: alpha/beta hydrolase, partial [Lachnospiraceae bacterium]|nr:alpha/beta hydrolase [Lachnospiraceae bacterium]